MYFEHLEIAGEVQVLACHVGAHPDDGSDSVCGDRDDESSIEVLDKARAFGVDHHATHVSVALPRNGGGQARALLANKTWRTWPAGALTSSAGMVVTKGSLLSGQKKNCEWKMHTSHGSKNKL